MRRYLVDTDAITLIQFGHSTAGRNLASLADTDVALAAVGFQEQMRGWLSRLNWLTAPTQQADWYDRIVKLQAS